MSDEAIRTIGDLLGTAAAEGIKSAMAQGQFVQGGARQAVASDATQFAMATGQQMPGNLMEQAFRQEESLRKVAWEAKLRAADMASTLGGVPAFEPFEWLRAPIATFSGGEWDTTGGIRAGQDAAFPRQYFRPNEGDVTLYPTESRGDTK